MSHGGAIIGIPGLEVERVTREDGIQVWANNPESAGEPYRKAIEIM